MASAQAVRTPSPRTRRTSFCFALLVGFSAGSHLMPLAAEEMQAAQRVYTVGVLTDNRPVSYRDERDGVVKGYVVDLLAAIEDTMDIRLERVFGPTSEINPAFESGRLDMLQSYVPNEDRLTFAAFTRPYLEMSGSIFVRRGETAINALADLRGRKVMVHERSFGAMMLRDAGLGDSIVFVGSVEDGFRLLDAGTNDATLAARLTGLSTIDHLQLGNVVAAGGAIPGYDVSYCFAVRKEHVDLLKRLNEGLAILDQAPDSPSGLLRESALSRSQVIYDKWFRRLEPERYSKLQIAIAVSAGLGLALAVALWALLRQRSLRRKIAGQADELRASEEGYRAVFESTQDGLVVLGAQPGSPATWAIVQLNPAARLVMGEPIQAKLPVPFQEAFPDDGTLWYRTVSALASTQPEPFEHHRSHRETFAWVHVSITRLGEGRRLVVIRDITDARHSDESLRRSEAQLRQNQKLEAIGTLASGIAHDFNNILTAILGNAELMRLDLPAGHPTTPALNEIIEASGRARFLVRQILTFSRKAESHREVVQVTPIVKETLRFVSATAPSTIEFRHRVDERRPDIEIDPTQFHQVMMNLCTNAVHAMKDRPGILEVMETAVTVAPDDNTHPAGLEPRTYLVVSIADTGTGMTPEVLQHIFEPFFTTKPSGEGTGLGLAVVHGIVHDSGGAISVSSIPGQGTTVRLYFPATTRARTPEESGTAEAPTGRGESVLFVDDEPAIAHAARRLIERLGYSVATFTQPEEALAEFSRRNGSFSVVVTDLTMPRMSGLELTKRLRVIAPRTPVILVSGFINDRELALARAVRVTQILDKPISLHAIGTAIAQCLRHDS